MGIFAKIVKSPEVSVVLVNAEVCKVQYEVVSYAMKFSSDRHFSLLYSSTIANTTLYLIYYEKLC